MLMSQVLDTKVKDDVKAGTSPAGTNTASTTPINYAVILFPGFQALDVFGPLDILNTLSMTYPINLHILSQTLEPVSTAISLKAQGSVNSHFSESIVPTHTFDNPPEKIDVLLIPGGIGTRAEPPALDPYISFIKKTYPQLQYLITVCTGVVLATRAGVLDGLSATGNKMGWDWIISEGPKVRWISHARWVHDKNVWTTSGVSAGMDGVFDFVKEIYGENVASNIADILEYERELDWKNDPFAVKYNLTDAVPK